MCWISENSGGEDGQNLDPAVVWGSTELRSHSGSGPAFAMAGGQPHPPHLRTEHPAESGEVAKNATITDCTANSPIDSSIELNHFHKSSEYSALTPDPMILIVVLELNHGD
jgi:hypothetical protein